MPNHPGSPIPLCQMRVIRVLFQVWQQMLVACLRPLGTLPLNHQPLTAASWASPLCHLAWDQSSFVCSQGNRFFPSSQTQGQTICLGLLKLHSRAQAPNPCLGGELLEAGWEQGPVGRGWVLWFTHRPGGQCRDVNNSSQRKAAATSVLGLCPLLSGGSGNPILLP